MLSLPCRYQARLIELQQKGGFGMQQIQALATEELLEEYIRNKCAHVSPSSHLSCSHIS